MDPMLCPCSVVPQMDTVLDHLSQALLQEGYRLKAWGFLGTGIGAELLRPGEPYSATARDPGNLTVPRG